MPDRHYFSCFNHALDFPEKKTSWPGSSRKKWWDARFGAGVFPTIGENIGGSIRILWSEADTGLSILKRPLSDRLATGYGVWRQFKTTPHESSVTIGAPCRPSRRPGPKLNGGIKPVRTSCKS